MSIKHDRTGRTTRMMQRALQLTAQPKSAAEQTAITFVTQEVSVAHAMGFSRSPKSGVVIWLPQDKLDELKALRR